MANPLPNEGEIYARIEKENIKIPRLVWELIEHHIGNDIHAMQFIAGSYIVGDAPEQIPVEDGHRLLERCEQVRKFLIKLREATREALKKV